ncbi:MAG: hypothetical protein WBA54_02410 [Acidaminobacteraceae bacterium]
MKFKIVLLIILILLFVACSADVDKTEEVTENDSLAIEEFTSEETKELVEE